MRSLRSCNYVTLPASVRALAQLAGMSGNILLSELMLLLGSSAYAQRPFYIVAHNPNRIADVNVALAAGANAIEPDVNIYSSREELCVDHGPIFGGKGDDGAPSLIDYLVQLRAIAQASPQLALIIFDCKEAAATPQHGLDIRDAVRKYLTDMIPDINVIISVPNVTDSSPYRLNGTTIFDQISAELRPREGCMIDEENDPSAVASFFSSKGVSRDCYGYGSTVFEEGDATYRSPLEAACWMKAARGEFRFIYAWTVNDDADQREYIRIGVDGIIADSDAIPGLRAIVAEPEFSGKVRLAARSDNPFLPLNASYGLTVQTGDVHMGGTDANVTFTLAGSLGSASVTVDTSLTARMERGQTNYVTLSAPNLGTLQSVTVQRDDSGNAPDWFLNFVDVQSYRYQAAAHGRFYRWIDSTAPFAAVIP